MVYKYKYERPTQNKRNIKGEENKNKKKNIINDYSPFQPCISNLSNLICHAAIQMVKCYA